MSEGINAKEIIFEDTTSLTVIIYDRNRQVHAKEINTIERINVSLKDIEDEVKRDYENVSRITVIAERPLHGIIYEYGNYGDFWMEHGKTIGYA